MVYHTVVMMSHTKANSWLLTPITFSDDISNSTSDKTVYIICGSSDVLLFDMEFCNGNGVILQYANVKLDRIPVFFF